MPTITALTIADPPEAWRRAGFTVDDDGCCAVGAVRLWLLPQEGRKGIISWTVDGLGELQDIDGLPTVPPAAAAPDPAEHANGVVGIDHLVVVTPDLDRTVGRLEDAGFQVRRTRDSDTYGAPMRQVFFRCGEVILEVVGGPRAPDASGAPVPDDRPPAFFGIAFTVADLATTTAVLGEHLGEVKDAVQPGRRITTLRKTAGLGTRVAFMSPGAQEYG